jgi:3-oxoadipate enol-lactonase
MRFRIKSGRAIGYATSGAGEVVVFLHPVGMSAAFWRPLTSHLPSHYRALAIDLRGHGDSDATSEEFSLDDLAEDAVELIHALGNGPCIVAGCSMGGMVAQGVALRAPELVRGLVLMNSGHTLPAAGRMAIDQRATESRKGMPLILQATIDRWFSEEFKSASPAVVDQVRTHLLACDPVTHSLSWRAIRDLDYESRLREIRCPVLVTTGSLDVSTPPALGQAMAQHLRNGTYREIPGAAHMAPLEKPELLAAWIDEFAAGLEPSRV